MKQMKFHPLPIAILLTSLLVTQSQAFSQTGADDVLADEPLRYIDDGVFISEAIPVLRIIVDEAFEYVGYIQFILKDIAHVDRHFFVSTRGSVINRLIVLQFEGFLDGVDDTYRGGIPTSELAGGDYRYTDHFVRLGDAEYVHNTWAFDHAANARDAPGAESAKTLEFLEAQGLRLADELIMSRYMRVVGADRRNELIIFYMETLRLSGHSLEEFPEDGPPTEGYDVLSAAVSRRAQRSFAILPQE